MVSLWSLHSHCDFVAQTARGQLRQGVLVWRTAAARSTRERAVPSFVAPKTPWFQPSVPCSHPPCACSPRQRQAASACQGDNDRCATNLTLLTAETKPAGAYRPPGARGALAPDVFKREDEGGPSHMMGSSGASSPNPMFRGGKPAQRYVPGAPPPGSAPEPKKTGKKAKKVANGGPPPELAPPIATPAAEPQGEADPTAKKIRNLTKKVRT